MKLTKTIIESTEELVKNSAKIIIQTELNDIMRMARIESIIQISPEKWMATICYDSLD